MLTVFYLSQICRQNVVLQISGVDHRPDRCNGEAERRLRQDDHRFHVLVRSEGGAEGDLMNKNVIQSNAADGERTCPTVPC